MKYSIHFKKEYNTSLLRAGLLVAVALLFFPSNVLFSQSTKKISTEEIISAFIQYVDQNTKYSNDQLRHQSSEVNAYIDGIQQAENQLEYINDKQINGYLNDARESLDKLRAGSGQISVDFLTQQYPNATLAISRQACLDTLQCILNERLDYSQKDINRLESAVRNAQPGKAKSQENQFPTMTIIIGIVVVLIIVLLVVVLRKQSGKRPNQPQTGTRKPNKGQTADPGKQNPAGVVVRRRTATILKKQSIDDVVDSPDYFCINCSDFAADSAVRRVYLRNTCIRDIYNMYAEDLSKSSNPPENGCMVVGRWLFDEESDEYYVTLEEIITPGDDAVLDEYEMNFGGKIMLKLDYKLRKLRKDTGLQYDLTCWIHSHPGLGVFFSAADNTVHEQLKSPFHPRFLTAIVCDILTENQEFAIFTYRHDSTLNARPDITRTYSLRELNEWATNSLEHAFNADNYRDVLESAFNHIDKCGTVQLPRELVLDLCLMSTQPKDEGPVAYIYGYGLRENEDGMMQYIIQQIVTTPITTAPEGQKVPTPIGLLIVGTHRSIPTIARIASEADPNVGFILFYSTTDGELSTIPMEDGQPMIDEQYYGQKKLEELKQWIRNN